MTAERISKLRELADRGVGGEMENAKAILTRLGLDWRKPKIPFKDKFKKTFGGDINHEYFVDIKYASDLLFINHLAANLTSSRLGIDIISTFKVRFRATYAESQDIFAIWYKYRSDFDFQMNNEAKKYINTYLKTI